MEQSRPLLTSELCVGVAEDESNCCEEVTLARSIAADNDIMFGREGLDDGLVLVTVRDIRARFARYVSERGLPLETLNDDLLDIHLGC